MKLNPDCIRAILMTVEENSSFRKTASLLPESDAFPLLASYTYDEVAYHTRQCELSNLIYNVHYYPGSTIDIEDLTPTGHEFLANIRENKIWNGAKEIGIKIGATSVNAFVDIASNIVTELIRSHFGLR